MTEPCKRKSGKYRAYFATEDEALKFAQDPANHPAYLGDIVVRCQKCPYYHLTKIEWLAAPMPETIA